MKRFVFRPCTIGASEEGLFSDRALYAKMKRFVFRLCTIGANGAVCFQTVHFRRKRSHTKSKHVQGNYDANKHGILKLSAL
jgi:hypothetical protein